MDEILTWFAKEVVQHALLHWAWLGVSVLFAGGGVVLGALMFGRRYKQRIAALESQAREHKAQVQGHEILIQGLKPGEKLPVKARLRHKFEVAWAPCPDGKTREIWIPVVWFEYEDGSIKPMDIKGMVDGKRGIEIFPLGPISFRAPDPETEE